jgi:hypothetical protein
MLLSVWEWEGKVVMSTMDNDRARDIAAAERLTSLSERQLAQLVQGIASARELAEKLPKDLHWSEEIALVFRLPQPGSVER